MKAKLLPSAILLSALAFTTVNAQPVFEHRNDRNMQENQKYAERDSYGRERPREDNPVNDRYRSETDRRFEEGYRDGDLRKMERDRYYDERGRIREDQRRFYRNDGYLSPYERQRLLSEERRHRRYFYMPRQNRYDRF